MTLGRIQRFILLLGMGYTGDYLIPHMGLRAPCHGKQALALFGLCIACVWQEPFCVWAMRFVASRSRVSKLWRDAAPDSSHEAGLMKF